MEEWIVESQEAWTKVIPQILEKLGWRRKIALYGEMGAGKTTFVKAFGAYLGVRENTASPTFSLVNQYSYAGTDGTEHLMHHLDLYRLRNVQEALDIGLEDLLYDPWFCLIEWPQLAESLLPENTAKITLEILGETSRKITLSF